MVELRGKVHFGPNTYEFLLNSVCGFVADSLMQFGTLGKAATFENTYHVSNIRYQRYVIRYCFLASTLFL